MSSNLRNLQPYKLTLAKALPETGPQEIERVRPGAVPDEKIHPGADALAARRIASSGNGSGACMLIPDSALMENADNGRLVKGQFATITEDAWKREQTTGCQ